MPALTLSSIAKRPHMVRGYWFSCRAKSGVDPQRELLKGGYTQYGARVGQKGYLQQQAKQARKPIVFPPDELWEPPAKELCDEVVLVVHLDIEDRFRLNQRQRHYQGQLVDYAVTLVERVGDGAWVEVTCIDCCHGHVHRHDGPHGSEPPTMIRPILSQNDVQQSFGESFDAVYNSYIEYVGEDI